MDAFDPDATTPEAYLGGTADWRTDLYATQGTLLSHRESIELFRELGVLFTPELKTPVVEMPFEGDYSQQDYARQMISDYIEAGVSPEDVWPQSFLLDDVVFWVNQMPEFGNQAVFLDEKPNDPANVSMAYTEDLTRQGVPILAPALWKMLTLDGNQKIVPSEYATNARAAGLDLIAWTVERSGPLNNGGGWYHQSISDAINNDGDTFTVIDVLAQDVGGDRYFFRLARDHNLLRQLHGALSGSASRFMAGATFMAPAICETSALLTSRHAVGVSNGLLTAQIVDQHPSGDKHHPRVNRRYQRHRVIVQHTQRQYHRQAAVLEASL